MVQQWIDASAGLAYISVGGQLDAFDEFLDAIEKLISHPEWRAGMPVVEDIRQCLWIPPAAAVEAWRSYVARHQALLEGCRWAVVTRGDSSVVSILDAAAHDAAPVGVVLKQFTNMVDAHLWVKRLAFLPSRTIATLTAGGRTARPIRPDDVESRLSLPREGDVLIARERLPRLDPHAPLSPQWRYRVTVFDGPQEAHTFTSFPHAASAAEQLASKQQVRVIYIEDGLHTVLADYRR